MRIGVYVGSFNPVHKGHKAVIDYLIDNDYLDKVIVIPTKEYWDKKDLLDIEKRIELLRFYESDKIIINGELSRFTYTYEILNELAKVYDRSNLYLIVGADNIINFDLWKNFDIILESNVIVLPRDGINVDEYIVKFEKRDKFLIALGFKEVDISSTEIRENIKRRLYSEVRDKIDDEILDYIIKNNLYV